MATHSIDEERLKELLKSAIVEVLEERKDLLCNLFEEALENIALAHAIKEGERSGKVSHQEVFNAFEGSH